MPRPPRLVLPDQPHHVTHRGNYKQQIFCSDADRHLYLDLVQTAAALHRVRLWGYCLMSNHVHWIVEPETPNGLAALFRTAHGSYARYRHLLERKAGHLWQARYYSCVLGESHRWYALAYVERNPVRAGLVRHAEHYQWSSAAAHVGNGPLPAWLASEAWRQAYDAEQWHRVLGSTVGVETDERRIRDATLANAAVADRDSLVKWSALSGRDLLVWHGRRTEEFGRASKPGVFENAETSNSGHSSARGN